MRLALEVSIQWRGAARLRNPTIWPVYFAFDDSVLLSLLGDISSPDYVFAPGPQKGKTTSWQATLSQGAVGAENALLGVGLLYSEGGPDNSKAQAAYDDFVKWSRGALLTVAARSLRLDPLLAAFGTGEQAVEESSLEVSHLLKGFDPLQRRQGVDPELIQGLEALAPVSAALRPLRGTVAVSHPPATLAEQPTGQPPPEAPRLELPISVNVIGPAVRPAPGPAVLRPTPLEHELPASVFTPLTPTPARAVEPGTIVASVIQGWRVGNIRQDTPLVARRPLKSRSVLRASVVVQVTIKREG